MKLKFKEPNLSVHNKAKQNNKKISKWFNFKNVHDIINHVFFSKNIIALNHQIQFYDPRNPVITLFLKKRLSKHFICHYN